MASSSPTAFPFHPIYQCFFIISEKKITDFPEYIGFYKDLKENKGIYRDLTPWKCLQQLNGESNKFS